MLSKAALDVVYLQDWDEMEDRPDEAICHNFPEGERSLHVRQRFVLLPCPCEPYIEFFPDFVRVCHRRVQ